MIPSRDSIPEIQEDRVPRDFELPESLLREKDIKEGFLRYSFVKSFLKSTNKTLYKILCPPEK